MAITVLQIGCGNNACKIGGETAMFRHEKAFNNSTALTIELMSSKKESVLMDTIKLIQDYKFERDGKTLTVDLFCITQNSSTEDFIKVVNMVKQNTSKGVILNTKEKDALKDALEILKSDQPAILLSSAVTDEDITLAKTYKASLIVSSKSFDDLAEQTEKIKSAGVTDIALNLLSDSLEKQVENNTIIRRAALKKNFEPFNYPLFTYINTTDECDSMIAATMFICKYSNILVLQKVNKAMLYTLLTLKQSIFS